MLGFIVGFLSGAAFALWLCAMVSFLFDMLIPTIAHPIYDLVKEQHPDGWGLVVVLLMIFAGLIGGIRAKNDWFWQD